MNCKLCNSALSSQEIAAYGGRCEDCWCRVGKWSSGGAAYCYTASPLLENAGEITNQRTPVGEYKARGRRIKK